MHETEKLNIEQKYICQKIFIYSRITLEKRKKEKQIVKEEKDWGNRKKKKKRRGGPSRNRTRIISFKRAIDSPCIHRIH